MNQSPKPKTKSTQKSYEELWLNYFNNVLLKEKLISEETYRKIQRQIILRSGRK